MIYYGIDIGGTKCAVTTAKVANGEIAIMEKESFSTPKNDPDGVLNNLYELLSPMIKRHGEGKIGISCGGPLDEETGIVLGPPNLPGWDHVEIVRFFEEKTGLKAKLLNDANASALAEWRIGAGKGTKNMVFMTFGTGLGAGLVLNGKLYSGTNGNAGEVGHVRMSSSGPVHYGKKGAWESFCSGSGIADLGKEIAGKKPDCTLIKAAGNEDNITAKLIAELARKGDKDCLSVYRKSGRILGKGLAMLIDVLNPETVVIGGVYMRSHDLLDPAMYKEIKKESLPHVARVCQIKPALLSENIGDYAAISAAMEAE